MFFLHRNKSISRVINRWCQEKTLDINSGINDNVTSNNWKILKLGKSTFSGFYNTFRESNLFDGHAFFWWSLQCDFLPSNFETSLAWSTSKKLVLTKLISMLQNIQDRGGFYSYSCIATEILIEMTPWWPSFKPEGPLKVHLQRLVQFIESTQCSRLGVYSFVQTNYSTDKH